MEFMEVFISILWLIMALISLIPLTIFYISYRRVKSKRILITGVAFFLFFIKGVGLSLQLFVSGFDDDYWMAVSALVDVVIIGLIAFSLSKRANGK